MTCIWNRNLHGWRVDRSNKHSQKQFLHLDHWTQLPKSRELDKYIWFVVRLRIGPVAASLNRLIDLLWRTIATSQIDHVHTLISNYRTIAPPYLWRSPGRWHALTDQRICKTCSVKPFGSIKHHLEPFTLILLDTNINPAYYEHHMIYGSTYLMYSTKIILWMPLTFGHLLEDIQFEMSQSLHYNFGQQILNLTSSVIP